MTIKEAREWANLTQAEVAKVFGVSKRAVEEWEGGRRNPKDKNIAEKIAAYGNLTSDGRAALLDGELSWEEAFDEWKIARVKHLSKWGGYPDTFRANWERIPAAIVETASAEALAVLVDSIKECYDDGVAYGRTPGV